MMSVGFIFLRIAILGLCGDTLFGLTKKIILITVILTYMSRLSRVQIVKWDLKIHKRIVKEHLNLSFTTPLSLYI